MSTNKAQLRAEYYERNPEGHFFDRETMKFFASRIEKCKKLPNGTWVLITSEKKTPDDPSRTFRTRIMGAKGVDTLDVDAVWGYSREKAELLYKWEKQKYGCKI